jgi:hypothetical protein
VAFSATACPPFCSRKRGHTRGVLKLALVSAVALVSTAAVGAGAATQTASLRLVDGDPLTLRGSAFEPSERVRVTVWVDARRWGRRVRAGPTGVFRVVFRQVQFGDPCTTDFRATAVGGEGSIARLKRPQRLCPMPLRGPSP